MEYRSADLYPNGTPANFVPGGAQDVIAYSKDIDALVQTFRDIMVDQDDFRSETVAEKQTSRIFLCFKRVDQTAGLGIWTDYDVTCEEDIATKGLDACSLLLTGISEEADEAVINLFEKHASVSAEVIDQIKDIQRPVVVNVYLHPEAVRDTDIVTAATALGITFFSLLGAE